MLKNRTITRRVTQADGDDGLINILGLNALRRGVRAGRAWQPISIVRADVTVSVGNWYYTDDVSARYTPDPSDPSTQQDVSLYMKDIKVGGCSAYASRLRDFHISETRHIWKNHGPNVRELLCGLWPEQLD